MSHRIYFNKGQQLNRRTVLKGAGVALSLPWLSAMQRAFATSAENTPPKRFVAMTLGLGLLGENLNPKESGKDYKTSLYLKQVQDLRDKFTVVSGSSHPDVSGGHRAEASILSAQPMGSGGQAKNTVSLDQFMAKHLGHHTRFPSLVLASRGTNSPSYTENGSMIPAQDSPSKLFSQLFIDDSPAEQQRQAHRLQEGRSIMDLVRDDSKRLAKKLGKGDQNRLDEYLTSVRDLENRMAASEEWAMRSKPKVDYQKPVDIKNPNDFVGYQRLMTDMVRLALQTDSTRFITYHLGGSGGVVPLEGVREGYHALSHHGRDEEKLEQLALVEQAIIGAWGDFMRDLNSIEENGHSLLDQTSVFMTSNLGNGSNHDNRNMPVLLAGGGFKHGQHLAFDQRNNYPLPNMYVSLLQNLGIETDQWKTATGTMTGLEMG
ncbi:DUF1552 domain-containing protein [Thalassoglobus polymorphus]|uniref:DUF1552 domain-containing protein n=1 Tax=Thalassoglobus polymorphus TaxID=2527994 RepID=A0A517QN15_9PLAN|nr:DUF1552 domain-containing protein [Thalassoglobus polymorphus]QDT33023.1 hypothetical protein Mal48_22750 [Thalassoglobus polymorphus]